jgi:hypothetical protein
VTLTYWRSVSDLHTFAHSGTHAKAWAWFNKTRKEYPHLGVLHELYDVPAKKWEASYQSVKRWGVGQTRFPKSGSEEGGDDELEDIEIVTAKRRVGTMLSRLGRKEL